MTKAVHTRVNDHRRYLFTRFTVFKSVFSSQRIRVLFVCHHSVSSIIPRFVLETSGKGVLMLTSSPGLSFGSLISIQKIGIKKDERIMMNENSFLNIFFDNATK